MLPDMDGFTILKKLREDKINTKIIMLTAKSTLDDKLEVLEVPNAKLPFGVNWLF